VIYNPDFKVMIIQCQITRKWYSIELYLQWPTYRKSYMINRMVPFSMTLVTLFFDAKYLRNGTIYRHSFNGIRPTQQCHFEWPWVTLSGLAEYSMTRSITRPLCDSRATCCISYYWQINALYQKFLWFTVRPV